ncbi:MAG: helix-turn-helix domain-containing protein, partial [Candidatus Margulisbacteria bacterium]|nr:helix-turn-helix domain-containing protein [Flavobacteriales bacterium]NQY74055.1 helix-turn-helix domain-containing protein [Candidatus Margulisiibacteriota bacterium]
RKPSINRNKILSLHKNGLGATAISKQMNIGRSTVYKVLNDCSE